jgi:hypothetical protein
MARYLEHDDRLHILTLTKKEAADMIALLVGQLAGCAVTNNHHGACPDVYLHTKSGAVRLAITLDKDE